MRSFASLITLILHRYAHTKGNLYSFKCSLPLQGLQPLYTYKCIQNHFVFRCAHRPVAIDVTKTPFMCNTLT